MFSALLTIFVLLVGSMAVSRTAGAFGRSAAGGIAVALLVVAALLPLGKVLALVVAAGALGVARAEEQRRLTG